MRSQRDSNKKHEELPKSEQVVAGWDIEYEKRREEMVRGENVEEEEKDEGGCCTRSGWAKFPNRIEHGEMDISSPSSL
jgi:hypothetical protein